MESLFCKMAREILLKELKLYLENLLILVKKYK